MSMFANIRTDELEARKKKLYDDAERLRKHVLRDLKDMEDKYKKLDEVMVELDNRANGRTK